MFGLLIRVAAVTFVSGLSLVIGAATGETVVQKLEDRYGEQLQLKPRKLSKKS